MSEFSGNAAGKLSASLSASLSGEEKRKLLARLLERNLEKPRTAPLSYAQQRLWFLDQLAPGSAFYNMPVALRLTQLLDVQALTRSLNEIVGRHETLRTHFAVHNDQQVQVIAPRFHLEMPLTDLSHFADPEAEARRQANEEARIPFDLSTGPLIRVKLLRLASDDHVLLLTLHHIIADGWSLGILFQELTALYIAFVQGKASTLPELPIQYADYAVWQREWLEGGLLQEQLAYWKHQLADMPALDLPTDHPRPAASSFRGARRFFTLPADIVQPLAALGRGSGATLFMTLFAAFQVLLHRYSGQEDFVVGVPIASRTTTETESLIGFFVNTLVLRANFSDNPNFRELLKRTRETTLGAYAHQDLPFERLVEQLRPVRDAARNPIVQVMFALQNAPNQPFSGAGSRIEVWEVERGTANFDLVVDFWESGADLGGRIEYSTDLYGADTIERFLEHLRIIFVSIVTRPDQPVALLPLLTPSERQQLLADWNATKRDYPETEPIAHLFETVAAKDPRAPAVTFGRENLTYGGLNANANKVAHYLIRSGIGAGDLVGIYLDRSAALVTAMLGILKAGAAYLPLDVSYPENRLAFMIGDARPRIVLTQSRLAQNLPDTGAKIITLDDDVMERENADNPASTENAGELAYVMYTSGSSGKPKGIEIFQRGVKRLVLNTDYIEIAPGDRIAQASNASFDAATFEIWGALLNGAHLIGLPREISLSSSELGVFLSQQKITTLFLTTAVFNQMARECPRNFLPLSNLLFGGEAADPGCVRTVLMQGAPVRLLHVYGPTECTTFSTWHLVENVPDGAVTVPIGRPIANTTAYVLDENRQPVPIGVPGELFIGGPGLARGYLNHLRLTAECFIQSDFGRLYRTGDVVRYRSDGHIEFIGRRDSQVKLRGFRVEPEEIQAVLSKHPFVQEAYVTARKEATGEQRLVAYLVPKPEDAAMKAKRVGEWRKVYDEVIYEGIYDEPIARSNPGFNTIGWKSTYTGQAIPAIEMREQVDQTVERIAAPNGSDILEIGCGTGLLLFRIAPCCRRYWATDFSGQALDYVRHQLNTGPKELPVRLFQQAAHDFTGIAGERFDAIILNSVVQYFPDIEYLLLVIREASSLLKEGGRIFVGDVRSLPLLEAFHAAVEFEQAGAMVPTSDLQSGVRRRISDEQELVIDPAFFLALRRELPQLGQISIQPKRGIYHNELTRFRYDVVLQVAESGPDLADAAAIADVSVAARQSWSRDGWTIPKLRQALPGLMSATPMERLLVLEGVPNARTWADVETALSLKEERAMSAGELRNQLRGKRNPGIDPEEFWALTDDFPFAIEISWASSYPDGAYDVIFRHRGVERAPFFLPNRYAGKTWNDYATSPRQSALNKTLVPELREYLKQNLPDYMIPSAMVVLAALPLTVNGKVDTRALPAPGSDRPALRNSYVAPRDALETLLADTWAKVLGLEKVGVSDSFFDIGGQSLLGTQLLSRVGELLGMRIPLRILFAKPRVADFGAALLDEFGPSVRQAAELLVAIDNMTEEDAMRLLSRREQGVEG